MSPEQTIWYRLGHAYERARLAGGSGDTTRPPAKAVAERDRAESARGEGGALALPWPDADDLLGAAIWLVLDQMIGRAGSRRTPGLLGLLGAGAAGALSALVVDLVRPLLVPDAGRAALDDALDRMIAGFGQGLLYGALVEPRIPGPALLKGALYGSVEFATDPAGGLSHLLSSHTPQGQVPIVGDLFAVRDRHDRAFLEHVVFGIALALLYESSASSSGTRPERDEDE